VVHGLSDSSGQIRRGFAIIVSIFSLDPSGYLTAEVDHQTFPLRRPTTRPPPLFTPSSMIRIPPSRSSRRPYDSEETPPSSPN